MTITGHKSGCVRSFAETMGPQKPGYQCNMPDCESRFMEQDQMILCEGCGKRVCEDHIRDMGDKLFYCDTCAKCERVYADPRGGAVKCGDAAKFACEHCGTLLCAGDARAKAFIDDQACTAGTHIVCRGGCPDDAPLEVLQVQGEYANSCPY